MHDYDPGFKLNRFLQQLDIERPYFNKIFRSISGIIARSPNASFRKKCTRMLQVCHTYRSSPCAIISNPMQTMQEQHTANFAAAAASLATYFGSSNGMEEDSTLDDDEAFSLSMEIRYRTCLRRPQFKVPPPLHLKTKSDSSLAGHDSSLAGRWLGRRGALTKLVSTYTRVLPAL